MTKALDRLVEVQEEMLALNTEAYNLIRAMDRAVFFRAEGSWLARITRSLTSEIALVPYQTMQDTIDELRAEEAARDESDPSNAAGAVGGDTP